MANIKEKSIRDMDFEEISIKYENLFSKIIWNELFKKINDEYRNKYQIFIRYKNEWYDSPSAMWRDKIAYGRNIIYWWFVEDLIIKVLEKNLYIKSKVHPTQKPVNLMRYCLEHYSEKWMIILDPFLWSWTTAVACKELGRNFIWIEKEQKYVDIVNKRLANTTISLF